MGLLDGVTPIVRGQCTACGTSRNLWLQELTAPSVPCNHADRGCSGEYVVVYRGPKHLIPQRLHNVQCGCGPVTRPDVPFLGSAAASSSDLHPGGDGSSVAEGLGECAICTEDLHLAQAAMRCTGQGGKHHYFHEFCLAQWLQQCRQAGTGPTCPECRGPVQVQTRKLREFLEAKGGKLSDEERETLRHVTDAANAARDDGWSDLKKGLWKIGVGTVLVAGVCTVAAIAVAALGEQQSGNKRDRRK